MVRIGRCTEPGDSGSRVCLHLTHALCVRTTVDIDDELVRAAKARALADGTTLSIVVEQGLRAILHGSLARPVRRIDLPVIGGTLRPGVDLDDHDAVKDLLATTEDAAHGSGAASTGS
ncbi:MAG: hypothetical protein ACRCZD_11035 [Phycicoccus sp.]